MGGGVKGRAGRSNYVANLQGGTDRVLTAVEERTQQKTPSTGYSNVESSTISSNNSPCVDFEANTLLALVASILGQSSIV